MAAYELMVLLASDQEESEREKQIRKIEETIASFKGKITSLKPLGKKELFYPIKNQKEANFYLLELEGPGNLIQNLDGKIRLQESILRHLAIRKEEEKKKTKK